MNWNKKGSVTLNRRTKRKTVESRNADQYDVRRIARKVNKLKKRNTRNNQ